MGDCQFLGNNLYGVCVHYRAEHEALINLDPHITFGYYPNNHTYQTLLGQG